MERSESGTRTSDTPATDAAARFDEIIDRAPAPPAVPLPRRWEPLATAIVGERTRVQLRTDSAARTALRAAGKVAATRGNVIHLAAEPQATAEGAALLAHELTHVSRPSPEARFFDDDRPSAEERFAERVAEVIRRSPVLPRSGAGAGAPGSEARARLTPPAPAIVRRSPANAAPARRDEPGTISAAALAARLTGSPPAPASAATFAPAPPVNNEIIRRKGPSRPSGASPIIGGHRGKATPPPPVAEAPEPAPEGWSLLTETKDSSGVQNLVDWIVEQVETRLARDLERRGGRYRGDF